MAGMTNRTMWRNGWQSQDTAYDGDPESITWFHSTPFGGTISVCSRMTGFGWRDVETGYRSPCGKFWLASGQYDIRDVLADLDSDEAMAAWVIDRANNCVAAPPAGGYVRRYAPALNLEASP